MKVLVGTDAHIFKTPDGKHYCESIYGYSFWERYLEVFDEVRIVARTKEVERMEGRKLLVDGPHVEVFEIPFFQGPEGYAKNFFRIKKAYKGVAKGCDVAILRLPSQTAQLAVRHLPKDMPVGGEIVYDLTDGIRNAKKKNIYYYINKTRSDSMARFCAKANGVSYVTEETLQEHYPSYARLHGEDEAHFETYYSTITLKDEVYGEARDFTGRKNLTLALSSVKMNSTRKGERTLLKAIEIARDKGYDVSAVIIGDGEYRQSFEDYASELGIREHVEFTGLLPSSDEVMKTLKEKADVFVFPSAGEGLPRGILEAMAIGMPVLSTPVGGIPEVIDRKYLFGPKDFEAFAGAICRLLDDPDELTQMSQKNFAKALEFKNSILQARRNDFYGKLAALAKK